MAALLSQATTAKENNAIEATSMRRRFIQSPVNKVATSQNRAKYLFFRALGPCWKNKDPELFHSNIGQSGFGTFFFSPSFTFGALVEGIAAGPGLSPHPLTITVKKPARIRNDNA
jgi:hypothetical protein